LVPDKPAQGQIQPVAERPDRVSAALSARLQGSRVRVSDETSETLLTYVNPDGTVTLEASTGPVRVKQGERWAAIDTTLVAADGVLKPKAALGGVEFSLGGEGKAFARLERSDQQSYDLSWPAALPQPRVEGSKAIYRDAAGPGADLVLTALPTGFRHDVVLRQRPTGSVEYKIPVQTKGLTFAESEQGGLRLTDAKGKTVAAAPEPFMVDSTNAPAASAAKTSAAAAGRLGSSGRVGEISASVESVNGDTVLTLKPDAAFLADPATRYPVTVDPSMELISTGMRTILGPYSDTSSVSGIQVSTYDNPTNSKREFTRALLKFDTSALVGKTVTDAKLQLTSSESSGCVAGQNIKAQRITAAWTPSSTFWANQPATTTAGEQLAQQPGQCVGTPPEGTWIWPITEIAKAWAGGVAGHGVMLRLATEHPVMYEQQYERMFASPTLIVTYGSTPAVENLRATPVATGDDGVVYTNTTTPTLRAFTKDPDGGQVRAEFEVEHDPAASGQGTGQVWAGAADGVVAGTEAQLPVAAGKLADGGKYRWRARAFDGIGYSAWSAWQSLAVDATAPQPPSIDCPIQQGGWAFFGSDDYVCWLSGTGDVDGFWWGFDNPSNLWLAKLTSGNVNYRLNLGEIAQGWHTLYAKSRDKAHNSSTVTAYTFGVTPGGIITPADKSQTVRSVPLTATAPAGRTAVRYEMTSIGINDFQPIPPSDVTVPGSGTPISGWPQTRSDASKPFAALSWDVAKSLQKYPTFDGVTKLRACFSGGATAEECTEAITITLNKSAFGGSAATAEVGPGTAALQNGDFSLTATDASSFGISVGRTFTSLNPGADRDDEQLAENKVFGPGWRASFPSVPSELADFAPTSGGESGSIQLVGSDGTTLSYVKDGTSFTGVGDAADGSRITIMAEQLTVTDPDGSKTTYTKAAGKWVVARTETAAAESAVTYYRDGQGRITRILAPVSADVTCGSSLTPGCRALELSYASATTATDVADGWGDYKDQVKSASFTAFDPESNAMKTTVLASYAYDSTGHLRQVTDPRTNLAIVYYYTGEGRISQITPPGLAPWRMDYDSRGRLAHVQREGGDLDPTQAVVYDVPIGGAGAPIDLTVAQTAKWGQASDLPVVGAAIFPASHTPTRGAEGAYTPTAADWEYGSLVYVNVNGRAVNTAGFGAGAWQISTTRYDDKGNTVWYLSADNRAQALTPTADTVSYVAARADAAERAGLLARITTYSADSDILTEIGSARLATLASGKLATVRDNVTNVYDEGKPTADTNYHLVTTTSTTPLVLDGMADENDKQTVTTGYDPLVSGDPSGWTLRKPTTSSSSQKSDIIQRTRYDAAGRQIERRMAESNGADAGTTAVSYYTAAAHPTVTACGNKPQWAGLTCQTAPKSQPPGTPIPIKLITYGYYGNEITTTETSGAVTRTTKLTYDAAGRSIKSKIEVQPASASTPIAEATYTYDPATGLQTTKSIGSDTINMGYDSFGRANSTTDATGVTSTAEYNLDGQIATSNDGKGVTTFTYDGTDAKGRIERRNLITKIDTGGAGVFAGAYDSAGRLILQRYPNGLEASSRYDNAGKQIGLSYAQNGAAWLSFTATYDLNGRIAAQQGSAGSAQRFDYDGAGRLTKVQDTYGGTCATRVYGFDRNTNRTSLTSYPADDAGSCSTTTTPNVQQHSYDAADRITDIGYAYDNLGRTIRVPSAQVTGGADLEVKYFVNDKAATLTQGSTQSTFTLDPGGRIKTMTTIGGPRPGTITHHYSGTEDSPTWISEADGTWTRNVPGLSGLGAIQNSDGTSTLQLINLHGDVVATSDNRPDAAGVHAYSETTEFGIPRAQTGDSFRRYGWLGSRERSSDAIGGLIFMGARLYNPQTGRFLQTDPITSGSANAYDYCSADPINKLDVDGTSEKPIWTTTTTSNAKHRDVIADNFLEVGFAAIVALATKPVANWWAAAAAGLMAGIAVSSIETTVESVTTTTVDVYVETRTVFIYVNELDDLLRKHKVKRSVQERRHRTVTTVTRRWRVITVIIPKFNAPRITDVGPWFTQVTRTTKYSSWTRG
jgi:RHS repeat-associated protein